MDPSSLRMNLPDADCLLVVPPAARMTWPALGVHQLQACAREAGFEVGVLYMNVLYGALVGSEAYSRLSIAPTDWMLGERLFCRAAFGAPRLGFRTEDFASYLDAANAVANSHEAVDPTDLAFKDVAFDTRIHRADLLAWEEQAFAFAEHLAGAIAARGYRVVGATSHFDQTSAALSVLARVKAHAPDTVAIIGGANCEGDMAPGMRSVAPWLDHVFSGESEETFVQFLQDLWAGRDTGPQIVQGAPCMRMDDLPTARFDEYFATVAAQPGLDDLETWLMYETSRGCWWGQKHHCTFCGFNAQGMGYREKSPDRVIAELGTLLASSPTRRVHMTDNIMPWRYHRSLMTRLRDELPGMTMFYEQKANLTLTQVKNLWDAGATTIQAGVEAIDTELTTLMRKGVFARQNVALLRYARCVGMKLQWNLLWGMPGDSAEPYRRTLALLPRLRHLCPPYMLTHLIIDRFSPYQFEPEAFGVENLRPLDCYGDVFPPDADLDALAYHFQGDYPSGSHDAMDLMAALNREIADWHASWRLDPRKRPVLLVHRAGPGRFVLYDTRGLGGAHTLYLNAAQAHAVIVGGPRAKVPLADWAIDNDYAVDLDGWSVPLAVAPYPLFAAFEDGDVTAAAPGMQVLRALP